MKRFKFIDVSGLGNSGKTAVVDFLREFEKIEASEYSFEFDLFRLPNGVVDLHYHLVEDWTHIRSNAAINSYLALAKSLAGSAKRKNIKSYLFSAGTGYERRFNNKFYKYSEEYINSFIKTSYDTFWPYYMIDDSVARRVYKKVLLKLKAREGLRSKVVLAEAPHFAEATTLYVNKLFKEFASSDKDFVVLNNTFEPFNPVRSLNILQDSKAILVTRDPRDIYVSGLTSKKASTQDRHLLPFDNNGINKSFLGGDDLDLFITRQKMYFEKLYSGNDSRVKIVRFEDFVLKPKEKSQEIMDFLGLSEKDHKYKQEFFKPEKSGKNVGLWKQYSRPDEIAYIEKHLKDYCF